MPRFSLTMSFMRVAGTRSARANSCEDMPRGDKNSARRISPGWIGGSRSLFAMAVFTPLVIIDNLNVLRGALSPGKTDSPLIVDSDAVLPLSIADQSLQPVSRNRRDVCQSLGVVKHSQFPPRDLGDIDELPATLSMKQL